MNQNLNHTPGPWKFDEKVALDYYPIYWNGVVLAEVHRVSALTSKSEMEANARLIAIAPDMAEAILRFNLAHDICLGGIDHPPTNEELEIFSQLIKRLTES